MCQALANPRFVGQRDHNQSCVKDSSVLCTVVQRGKIVFFLNIDNTGRVPIVLGKQGKWPIEISIQEFRRFV